jgi:hypothetical protein
MCLHENIYNRYIMGTWTKHFGMNLMGVKYSNVFLNHCNHDLKHILNEINMYNNYSHFYIII